MCCAVLCCVVLCVVCCAELCFVVMCCVVMCCVVLSSVALFSCCGVLSLCWQARQDASPPTCRQLTSDNRLVLLDDLKMTTQPKLPKAKEQKIEINDQNDNTRFKFEFPFPFIIMNNITNLWLV